MRSLWRQNTWQRSQKLDEPRQWCPRILHLYLHLQPLVCLALPVDSVDLGWMWHLDKMDKQLLTMRSLTGRTLGQKKSMRRWTKTCTTCCRPNLNQWWMTNNHDVNQQTKVQERRRELAGLTNVQLHASYSMFSVLCSSLNGCIHMGFHAKPTKRLPSFARPAYFSSYTFGISQVTLHLVLVCK